MNSFRLGSEIRIESADDDPSMFGEASMKLDEIFSIQSQHSAFFACRESKNLIVRDGLLGAAGFLDRQDIMTELPQAVDREAWEVLVGVEAQAQASSFSAIRHSISSRCVLA